MKGTLLKNDCLKVASNLTDRELSFENDNSNNKNNNNKNDDESPLIYKLRASSVTDPNLNDCWVRPPTYFDEEAVRELSNEQIKSTLDYFILSGYRVSQMTKTYDDIEAVTKLLDEKEKDLELAATIGKQLLEKDQELELKIEFLELQLEKTTDMVNQLRYDLSLKDNLLKTFLDAEYEDNCRLQEEEEEEERAEAAGPDRGRRGGGGGVNSETLNEYRKQIECLEDENDLLRSRADYFEKESSSLKTRHAETALSCARELESSQANLRSAQSELRLKTAECASQHEQIQGLFAQIFELQLRIKTIAKENGELLHAADDHHRHNNNSNNDGSSKREMLEQIAELRHKYSVCMSLLNKTQEELIQLRKRSGGSRSKATAIAAVSILSSNSVAGDEFDEDEDDDDDVGDENAVLEASFKPAIFHSNKASSVYSPWMLTGGSCNSKSLAAELFSSMAREFRLQNANMPGQVSRSSDFVSKVKQKMIKQIPGSANIDSMQSDSEIESMLNSSSNHHFDAQPLNASLQQPGVVVGAGSRSGARHHCPTPDSCLSTGSASLYSNLPGRSHSTQHLFTLPERLLIVKPIEGSQTLQHWRQLATPNLGCLFQTRPGISIKGGGYEDEIVVNNKKDELARITNDGEEDYDDGIYEQDEGDFYDNDDEFMHELEQNGYFQSDDQPPEINENNNNNNMRVLTPSKVELLSRLLENEENSALGGQESSRSGIQQSPSDGGSFMGFIRHISAKFYRSTSNGAETAEAEAALPRRRSSPGSAANRDCADPGTPPSSPINVPSASLPAEPVKLDLLGTFRSVGSYLNIKRAPTPPGTPTNELEETSSSRSSSGSSEEEEGAAAVNSNSVFSFFDLIVSKLSLFSFTKFASEASNVMPEIEPLLVRKPLPVYAEARQLDEEEIDDELAQIEQNKQQQQKFAKCSTPPPSPSKFSPPLPDMLENQSAEYTAEQMRKSAFVRVATLNPLLSKSMSIDLNTLLGSLSTLKRNQQRKN